MTTRTDVVRLTINLIRQQREIHGEINTLGGRKSKDSKEILSIYFRISLQKHLSSPVSLCIKKARANIPTDQNFTVISPESYDHQFPTCHPLRRMRECLIYPWEKLRSMQPGSTSPDPESGRLRSDNAFVVLFRDFEAGRCSGRIEHVRSGRTKRFQSWKDLKDFVMQVLSTVRADEPPSDQLC